MTERQNNTAPPDRAAHARAARSLRSQQRQADRLTALGWTCTPPVPAEPTPTALWEADAAREIADLVDDRTLILGGGVAHGHDRRWDAYSGPSEAPQRLTLICHDRPSDPVVVEVLVRLVEGQVP